MNDIETLSDESDVEEIEPPHDWFNCTQNSEQYDVLDNDYGRLKEYIFVDTFVLSFSFLCSYDHFLAT